MLKKINFSKIEVLFFYAFLSVNALFIICNRSNPSLDGPAHLYYAHLINYLASGNEFISTYFTVNKIPVPNITDHYLLALFTSVLPYAVAEKLLLLIFIIGFPLTFRYLIKIVNPERIGLSAFAIVFSQSFLYYIGFYNFCLSFVFLFASLGVYLKYFQSGSESVSIKGYLLLFIFIELTYFTNGLSFAFLAVVLFLYELSEWIGVLSKKQGLNSQLIRRTGLLALLWLPCLICLYLFVINVPTEFNAYRKYPTVELMQWIYNIRPLIVYSQADQSFTRIIFALISILVLVSFYFRIKSKTLFQFSKTDILLLIASITLALFFIIPDSTSVGMMSVRLCFYFFIFLIAWLAMQQGKAMITWGISIIALSIQAILLMANHAPTISRLNREVEMVRSTGQYIKPNSVVLPIDVTDDWPVLHFADYLGIDKPLAIIECSEASMGWFAVNWNKEKMPKILLGDKTAITPVLWTNNLNSATVKHIDYIYVYGDLNQISEPKWAELKTIVDTEYKLVFASTDDRIHIYGLL